MKIMRNWQSLPDKRTVQNIKDGISFCDRAIIIFPDGEESFKYNQHLVIGYSWFSAYWGEFVSIVELSEDKKYCWVEGKNDGKKT